jgi:hypothetical protein
LSCVLRSILERRMEEKMKIFKSLTTVFLILAVFSAGQVFGQGNTYFKSLNFMYQEGDKLKDQKARITFTDEKILITDEDKPERATYADISIASIDKVTYEKSAHTRWKTGILLSPFALMSKGKKHWLTIQYKKDDKTDFIMLRMDKSNYQMIIATIEAKT